MPTDEEQQRAQDEGRDRRRLILVVEDSRDVGDVLATAIEEQGWAARIARGGRVAIDLARDLHPDLVTLDLALPDMSGLDVLAALREDPRTRAIPVIAITAHQGEVAGTSIASQVEQLIPKPFYLSDVLDAIEDLLERQPPAADET